MIDYRSSKKCADGTQSCHQDRSDKEEEEEKGIPFPSEYFKGNRQKLLNTMINVVYIDFVGQLNASVLRWFSSDLILPVAHSMDVRQVQRARDVVGEYLRPFLFAPYSKKNGSNTAKTRERGRKKARFLLSFSDVAFCQRCYLRSRRESTTRDREKEWGPFFRRSRSSDYRRCRSRCHYWNLRDLLSSLIVNHYHWSFFSATRTSRSSFCLWHVQVIFSFSSMLIENMLEIGQAQNERSVSAWESGTDLRRFRVRDNLFVIIVVKRSERDFIPTHLLFDQVRWQLVQDEDDRMMTA